jgi:hypothetical protein
MRVVLALIAIMVLAGCGEPSVEAARAAVPHVPAPHVPPPPRGHIPHWEPYEPHVRPRVVPPDVASEEVLKELRVRELERRYAKWSALVPYACKAAASGTRRGLKARTRPSRRSYSMQVAISRSCLAWSRW